MVIHGRIRTMVIPGDIVPMDYGANREMHSLKVVKKNIAKKD